MELHRPNNVALGENDGSYGCLPTTNREEVPQKHELLGRGLRKIQSQRSFFQGPKELSFSGVVEKSGSDPRKLMLSSLGTSFRRSTKPRSIEPFEDITETARSTKHFDYGDTNAQEGKLTGAFIEEVSPVVSIEDRRSRFSKKVGSSLRKLQGVSFRRNKSSKNLIDEPGSANIEEPVDISVEELHISIRSIEEDGGTDTLERLGWSLRRVNTSTSSAIATDQRERTHANDFSTSEAIEESSETSMEDFISPLPQEEAIKEHPSEHQERLHVDMVGEIEFCKYPKKSSPTTLPDKLADVDAIKIQPEIVKFCRKPSPVTSSGCNPLPALSEDRQAKLPEKTLEDAVAPLPALEPSWPTAEGVNPFEKVNQAPEESSTRKKLGRRKLKRSFSVDSSIRHSFRKMLSFRTADSKQNCSSKESHHERRRVFRFGSRSSSGFRKLLGRSKSSVSMVAVNSTSNTGARIEESKDGELEKPGGRKSDKPAGQNTSTPVDPNPSKQEERKTALARIRTKGPLKDSAQREAVKKSTSLQLEHESMMKGSRLQERKALMSRLVRRAVSFPIPRQTDDKTAAADMSAEFSKQDIPEVVGGQDSVSAISSLGFLEANTTPSAVECKEDSSTVSSLGRSDRSLSDNVPSIIACVQTNDLEASSLNCSFSGSKS